MQRTDRLKETRESTTRVLQETRTKKNANNRSTESKGRRIPPLTVTDLDSGSQHALQVVGRFTHLSKEQL